ncbi:ATP-binding protein [Granulibacter bethesdensis]|uniref:ATP-binding protein n=1 Tax=Granulibacter bethesdensis TaxID=364410 RepID=UPI0003F1D17B|nr:ATP-binding protein [Granulibacter bethesdensis]AHJ67890.1 Osmolarity sensor protein envZ [Granulibacter bethesdensis]
MSGPHDHISEPDLPEAQDISPRFQLAGRMQRAGLRRAIKKFLPRSLLGRSLLIILLPLVLVQAVSLKIFYGSHLDVISRRLSFSVAGEIAYTIDLLRRFPDTADQDWILRHTWGQFAIMATIRPGATLSPREPHNILGPMDDDLRAALEEMVKLPFTMDWISDTQSVLIHVQLPQGVLDVKAPRKRLYTATIYLFLFWTVGSALLLFAVAALFMRNQVRAIRRLAGAAEAFGMGRDRGPIKPEGAIEVRRAATAFNRMQERIRRFITQRTEMLAGVSHDLRTPLTRLRLAVAMLPSIPLEELPEESRAMIADLEDMERMIKAYLAFARGEGTEQTQPSDLVRLVQGVVNGTRRAGADITLSAPPELMLPLRPDACRRAVANLVDNACRHGQRVVVSINAWSRAAHVTVDDDGPGLAQEWREAAFKPFQSGSAGGTGLGLAISRDIIRSHGGDITLEDSPLGGLRARITLPL